MADSAAMTIDFLRARLLSERSVSRAAKERSQMLARRVAELEEQVKTVADQRRRAEKAAAEVLAILHSQGITGAFSPLADSATSDSDGGGSGSGSAVEDAMSGSKLAWKGRSASPRSRRRAEQLQQSRRRSFSFSLPGGRSPSYTPGQSCRKIRNKNLWAAGDDGEEKGPSSEDSPKGDLRSDCTEGSNVDDRNADDLKNEAEEDEEWSQREWERRFAGCNALSLRLQFQDETGLGSEAGISENAAGNADQLCDLGSCNARDLGSFSSSNAELLSDGVGGGSIATSQEPTVEGHSSKSAEDDGDSSRSVPDSANRSESCLLLTYKGEHMHENPDSSKGLELEVYRPPPRHDVGATLEALRLAKISLRERLDNAAYFKRHQMLALPAPDHTSSNSGSTPAEIRIPGIPSGLFRVPTYSFQLNRSTEPSQVGPFTSLTGGFLPMQYAKPPSSQLRMASTSGIPPLSLRI